MGSVHETKERLEPRKGLNWGIGYSTENQTYYLYFRYLSRRGTWMRHEANILFHDMATGGTEERKLGTIAIGKGKPGREGAMMRVNGKQIDLADIKMAKKDRLRLQKIVDGMAPVEALVLNRADEIVILDANTRNNKNRIRVLGDESDKHSNVRTLARNLRVFLEHTDHMRNHQ